MKALWGIPHVGEMAQEWLISGECLFVDADQWGYYVHWYCDNLSWWKDKEDSEM